MRSSRFLHHQNDLALSRDANEYLLQRSKVMMGVDEVNRLTTVLNTCNRVAVMIADDMTVGIWWPMARKMAERREEEGW